MLANLAVLIAYFRYYERKEIELATKTRRHEDTRENIYWVKIDLYNSANLLFTEIDKYLLRVLVT